MNETSDNSIHELDTEQAIGIQSMSVAAYTVYGLAIDMLNGGLMSPASPGMSEACKAITLLEAAKEKARIHSNICVEQLIKKEL